MKLIRIAFYLFITAVLLNACQKEYSNESGNTKLPSGTWQFMDSANAKLFVGNMDSAIISFSSNTNTQELHLFGTSADGSQTFDMQLFADTIKPGTYKASLFQSAFTYSQTAKTLYQAGQLTGEFTVTITTLTSSLVTGTFTGFAIDSANALKTLTVGKFTSTIGGSNGVAASIGVLGDDSTGNCKPVTLSGTYLQGVALTSANTAKFQVTVGTPGTYTISSNKINGVTFSGTGTFLSAGVQNVVLTGSGTPLIAGDQNFTIAYGNSQCGFKVTFASSAAGTLGGGGGTCTPFTIAGTYQQGILLTTSNTVQINVTVTTPGAYNITTNASNGVTFSKTGSFTATGSQTVTLVGVGTPQNSGAQNFSVSFGTSSCSFSIPFLPGVSPSGDYFPVTANSNWTYDLVGGTPSDSVHYAILNYSPTFGGTSYKTIGVYNVPPSVAYDSFYYRKPGGDYYQYAIYSNIIPFDQQVSGEFIFLKDNVAVGTTWVSPNISGTIGGVAVTASIKMTLLYQGAVTIGTFNFPDVIKVQYEYMLSGFPTSLETDERWFARNVGEIHDSLNNGSTTSSYDIGTYQVF
jgi:hypothetical protein